MRIRTAHTTIADAGSTPAATHEPARLQAPTIAPKTLWAEQRLPVQGGSLVAVRLREDGLRVGFISDDTRALKWVQPEHVLSEQEAQRWIRTARFRP